jgi:hypothetical protein
MGGRKAESGKLKAEIKRGGTGRKVESGKLKVEIDGEGRRIVES